MWASVVATCGLSSCEFVAPGLQSTGFSCSVQRTGFSCLVTYRIFPDQGSNLYLLHWQADSLPLSHQGGLSVVSSHTFLITCHSSGRKLTHPFPWRTLELVENVTSPAGLAFSPVYL